VKPSVASNELSTRECFDLIDDIASFSSPVVMVTGGEPMFRKDLPAVVDRMSQKGIGTTLSPCGPLVTVKNLSALKEAGLGYISFNIDAMDAATHDSFRRYPGAFASVMEGIDVTKKVGMDFAIFTTVTKHNYNDLSRIMKTASTLGAAFFIPFFLVPTGKGREIRDQQISPQEYEKCLNWIYEVCKNKQDFDIKEEMVVRVACAPHFYRINYQREGIYKLKFFDTEIKEGCLAGMSFLFISHIGKVQPCGYLELVCGDVRKDSLANIWQHSEYFQKIRDLNEYQGKCNFCEFISVCRGCRARAFTEQGNYMHEDPFCNYLPAKLEKLSCEKH
jgi:radical SAM protein with 4Fe4S-binding SPASM domain